MGHPVDFSHIEPLQKLLTDLGDIWPRRKNIAPPLVGRCTASDRYNQRPCECGRDKKWGNPSLLLRCPLPRYNGHCWAGNVITLQEIEGSFQH